MAPIYTISKNMARRSAPSNNSSPVTLANRIINEKIECIGFFDKIIKIELNEIVDINKINNIFISIFKKLIYYQKGIECPL